MTTPELPDGKRFWARWSRVGRRYAPRLASYWFESLNAYLLAYCQCTSTTGAVVTQLATTQTAEPTDTQWEDLQPQFLVHYLGYSALLQNVLYPVRSDADAAR